MFTEQTRHLSFCTYISENHEAVSLYSCSVSVRPVFKCTLSLCGPFSFSMLFVESFPTLVVTTSLVAVGPSGGGGGG